MKFILTILLFPFMLNAQDTTYAEQLSWTEQIPVKVSVPKFYHFSKNEIVSIPVMALSGMYKAYREAINYKGFGRGEKFWDIRTSHQNKYRNWPTDLRERFPGSKTIFSPFIDGNHLMQASSTVTYTGGTYFVLADLKSELKMYKGWQRVGFIVVRKFAPFLIRSFTFEQIYKVL